MEPKSPFDFADMHLCYQARLSPYLDSTKYRRVDSDGGDLTLRSGAVALILKVDEGGMITQARHEGATGETAALLEAFCESIEGLSLGEVRAHGALRLEYRLRSPELPPPVPGLITAENADPAFSILLQLTHSIPPRDSARSFPTKPRALTRAALTEIVREELVTQGYAGPAVSVFATGTPHRWLLSFSEGTAPKDFFLRLLSLERRVRARTASDVELFLEGKDDRNQRNAREPRTHDLHPGA